VVVPRIGISAVAILAAGGERLLVVPLDGAHTALDEQRPDLLRLGPEAAEIAKAVDRLGTAAGRVFQQRGEPEAVVVDASEDRDAAIRPFDRRRVWSRSGVGLDRRGPFFRAEAQARGGGGGAEVAQWDEPLAPGGEAAMRGQLRGAHVLQLTP